MGNITSGFRHDKETTASVRNGEDGLERSSILRRWAKLDRLPRVAYWDRARTPLDSGADNESSSRAGTSRFPNR